jgi:hypothetical protein
MPKAGVNNEKDEKAKPRSPRCRTCGKTIRVPQGWSVGPAVRRHYWSKHRDVMTGNSSR